MEPGAAGLLTAYDALVVPETQLRVEPLARRPDLVNVVAQWHWDEWGLADPSGSVATWASTLRQRANTEGIPIMWLAFLEDVPVGSVALVDNDLVARPELWPWLSGLFVLPAYRHRGIGSALVRHCEGAARDLGFDTLYLYASSGLQLYAGLGYEVIERMFWEGEFVAIMSKRLEPPPHSD